MPSDADLARSCCRGDAAAFGELIQRCTPMVCAVAYAATHDRALAEDVAQDTFLAAWRDAATLRDPAAVRPWLCRIARNLAHKARRARVHEQLAGDLATHDLAGTHTPFDAMHDAQVERAVAAALAAVPEPYREALVLFYFEHRSARSVAAALGVSEAVVHKRVSRGRSYLATELDQLAEGALRRPPRRDFSACVLALLPRQPTAKGTLMWKLAVAAVTVSIVTTALLSGTSAATPSSPAAHPVTVPHASPSRPVTRAPAAPTLPDPTDCGAVAKHLVTIVHVTDAKPERVTVTTTHLDKLCRRLAWPRSERQCMLVAEDKASVEFCRNAAEHRPGSRDAEPVAAIHATDCPALGDHVADLMVAESDGTEQDNIEVSLMLDPGELHRDVREACGDQDWPDELRHCFAAATTMAQLTRCRLAYDADE